MYFSNKQIKKEEQNKNKNKNKKHTDPPNF